jgi:hypothetical protein
LNTSTPQQTLPFDSSPPTVRKSRKHKQHRINEVSKLSFDEVKKKRNKAFLKILRVLSNHNHQENLHCLTARQLLRILHTKGEEKKAYDRNIVSPRLCELLDIGCVENPVICTDEGEEVFFTKRVDEDAAASVWRVTDKGIELLDCLEKLESEVKL